jgi:hypothetical protein
MASLYNLVMAKGRLGYTSQTVRRKDLKPKKEMSDEQLLRSAERAAAKWQEKLRKTKDV